MTPNFSLFLNHDSIALNMASSGRPVGAVSLDDPDFEHHLTTLRRQALKIAPVLSCKIILPQSQIFYRTLTAAQLEDGDYHHYIQDFLTKNTPYHADKLFFDWVKHKNTVYIAAVCKKTVQETGQFLRQYDFIPRLFTAIPLQDSEFHGEPWFYHDEAKKPLKIPAPAQSQHAVRAPARSAPVAIPPAIPKIKISVLAGAAIFVISGLAGIYYPARPQADSPLIMVDQPPLPIQAPENLMIGAQVNAQLPALHPELSDHVPDAPASSLETAAAPPQRPFEPPMLGPMARPAPRMAAMMGPPPAANSDNNRTAPAVIAPLARPAPLAEQTAEQTLADNSPAMMGPPPPAPDDLLQMTETTAQKPLVPISTPQKRPDNLQPAEIAVAEITATDTTGNETAGDMAQAAITIRPQMRPAQLQTQTAEAPGDAAAPTNIAGLAPRQRPRQLQTGSAPQIPEQDDEAQRIAQAVSLSAGAASVAANMADPPATQTASLMSAQSPMVRPRAAEKPARAAPPPVAAAPQPETGRSNAQVQGTRFTAVPGEDEEPDVAPAASAPRIPVRASVAKNATYARALNLRQTNLIGVYGSPSNRYAMIRTGSGSYKKIGVGDRVDGGTVAAITENEVRYQKGQRIYALTMPRG